MQFVMTGLNDIYILDSADASLINHIKSLNQAASIMYSNATQSLQVAIGDL